MQKNSFVSFLEQIALLNKNSVEIITKLNDVVSSNQDVVSVDMVEPDGTTAKYQLPSVGYLKKQVDIANANIRKLSGLQADNSVIIIDGKSSKKIQSIDINREPSPITTLNNVTKFQEHNNWFFESLINPLLTVELDLAGKVDDHVKKILSRRYIVKFEKNDDGTLTTNGQTSLTDFKNIFLNKTNFTINQFLTWLTNPTNVGVLNRIDPNFYMDEQYFDLNYKEVDYKGYFSVMKIESDRLNNKVWYHLDTLNYFGRNGSTNTIKIGDALTLTRTGVFSMYNVTDINTTSSLVRVALERVEGYDPIPVGTSVLSYYSSLTTQKTVDISIGFDEYNVIFIRPVNVDNYIISAIWSKGMAFYTNDLVLDTNSNLGMADYYINSVSDYGAVLEDMVAKNIPSQFGSVPNKPVLNSNNFKVVQTNQHLTDTKDTDALKKLHSQKTTVKATLNQLSTAIQEKNVELNNIIYKSSADKAKAQNELNNLITNQQSQSKLLASIISQIVNSKSASNASPEFSVRGFWDIPDPIIKQGYKPQEVIGFEYQFRKSSKFGTENKTEGFNIQKTDTTGNIIGQTNAYFSNWIPIKTDIRKRAFDSTTGQWYWKIEDVSNADTPNINQLDIILLPDEKVEIRTRSISEVGYPNSPLYSDWSDIITIEFPEDLKDISGGNSYIMKEANQEDVKVQFTNELQAQGYPTHISKSYFINQNYVAHDDLMIATSFKDNNGNTLMLFDYLKLLNDKITALEESVKRAKGELKVTLFSGTNENELTLNSKTNITIFCDDYAVLASGNTSNYTKRSYLNNIYLIQDYYLEFKNISTDNPLGVLTKTLVDLKMYTLNTIYLPTFLDSTTKLVKLDNGFFINLLPIDLDNPDTATQNLYDGDDSGLSTVADVSKPVVVLSTPNKCFGGSVKTNILTATNWKDTDDNTIAHNGLKIGSNKLLSTIHPYIDNINNVQIINDDNLKIFNAQESFKLPLNIYFKLDGVKANTDTFDVDTTVAPLTLLKKLRFYVETENQSRPMIFEIDFKLIQYKQYSTQQQQISTLQTVVSNSKK